MFIKNYQTWFQVLLHIHIGWIVISEFMDGVVTSSNEKKAPPSMDRLQKGYCTIAWVVLVEVVPQG